MKNLIFRLIITAVIFLSLQYKTPEEFYDIVIALLLFLGLLISLREVRNDNFYDIISHYLYWIFVSYIILDTKKELLFNLKNILVVLLFIKGGVLLINYLKYKKMEVPSTILSKFWLFTLFIYLIELITNSTHITKELCFYTGLVSAIESIYIILKTKNWKPRFRSFLDIK